LSSEITVIAEADTVEKVEGNIEAQQWPSVEILPESKSTARSHGVLPGTWEVLASPSWKPVQGFPVTQSQAYRRCALRRGSEGKGAAAVPPSEGNEVRREGRQEVGVLS
jgi:hypothetical protein